MLRSEPSGRRIVTLNSNTPCLLLWMGLRAEEGKNAIGAAISDKPSAGD
jgi:hypothetical protein